MDKMAPLALIPVYDKKDRLKKIEKKEFVQCKDCKHRDPEDKKCDCGYDIRWQLPRPDDFFCAYGEGRK